VEEEFLMDGATPEANAAEEKEEKQRPVKRPVKKPFNKMTTSEKWEQSKRNAINNKRKGAEFELRRVDWHREQGRDAERLRLAGAKDEGDIAVRLKSGIVVVEECKTVRPGQPLHMPSWWREAVTEAENYARARQLPRERVIPALVVRRHGSTDISQAWVIMDSAEWWAGRDQT
jgi:hypothetical protein